MLERKFTSPVLFTPSHHLLSLGPGTWDIWALYQYFWCFKFHRNGRLMSENNEGVVMSQADNRYNLILLGSHLSHPQSGNSSCQTFICILSFHFLFALHCHCSVNKKNLSTGNWIFYWSIGSIYRDNDGEIMWVQFSYQWKLLWRVWMSSSQWTGCSQQIPASIRWGKCLFHYSLQEAQQYLEKFVNLLGSELASLA